MPKAFFRQNTAVAKQLAEVIQGHGQDLEEDQHDGGQGGDEGDDDNLLWWALAGDMCGVPRPGFAVLADGPPDPEAQLPLGPTDTGAEGKKGSKAAKSKKKGADDEPTPNRKATG